MKLRKAPALLLALTLTAGLVPAAWAAELPAPEGLSITWYTDYEGLMRRYGTDRMLLVKDGKSGLFGLDGTKYTDCVFDAFGEFNGSGLAPACQNGKWGMVDMDGKTVVDFTYDGQYEAEVQAATYPTFKGKDGKDAPPYALFAPDGTRLTGYDFWAYRSFVNGFAMVTDGKRGWRFIDMTGEAVTEQKYSGDSLNDPKMGGDEFGPDGYAIVQYEDRSGYNIIDNQGRELLAKPSYIKPWRAGRGLWGYEDRDSCRVGFMDGTGRVVIQPQYLYMKGIKGYRLGYEFNEKGVARVYTEEEPGGFDIDLQGNRVEVEPDDEETGWYEGLKWVNYKGESAYAGDRDGPWGFMDKSGVMVVPAVFDAVGYFDHGYASVNSGDTFGLLKNPLTAPAQGQDPAGEAPLAGLDITWVDTENKLTPEGYDNLIQEFHIVDYRYGRGGPFPYGDYGLRNADGQEVTPVLYGTTLPGGPGYDAFTVKEEPLTDGTILQTDFLGRTSEKKSRPDWDPAVPSAYKEPSPDGHDKWGFNNPWTGEIVLPAIYDAADDFSEGIAIVEKDGRQYAIDEQGQELFDLSQYRFVGKFSEGRAWVRRVEPFGEGFIDTTGKEIIPARWNTGDMEEFQEGYVTAWDLETDLAAILDRDGNFLIPAILEGATSFESGVAVITYQGRQGILKNPDLKHKTSSWAAAEVKAADEAGYVTSSCETYQTFTITRARFAELAVNYVEKKTGKAIDPAPADTFTDTADETIRKAYAAGIVQGVGNGKFSPGGLLTREQLATMLWRAMEKVGVGMHYGSLPDYADADQISDWAEFAINNLIHHGIMAGTGGNMLSPKDSCTVEQAILLVNRTKEFPGRQEKDAQHQAALDRVTVEGIEIGIPFEDLAQNLREALKPQGEPYDSGVFNPGEEIGQRYAAPGIEVITSQATEKVLQRVLEGQDKEYLLKYYGSEDWREVYEREKGREYVDKVILTGDNYAMVSGLKVGDSGARVRELGYPLAGETYSETVGFDGSAKVYMGNDVVERIEVWDCIGRRIGPFMDP